MFFKPIQNNVPPQKIYHLSKKIYSREAKNLISIAAITIGIATVITMAITATIRSIIRIITITNYTTLMSSVSPTKSSSNRT
jgi:hypothetical protein